MIPLVVFAVAAAIGVARGGRLRGLTNIHLSGGWIAIVFFVAQFFLRETVAGRGVVSSNVLVWLWCAVSAGLIAVCVVNWHVKGVSILAAGIALNLIVVLLNTGMPVGGSLAAHAGMTPSAAAIEEHGGFYRAVDSETVATSFGDVVPIPLPRPFRSLVSIGDLLMFLGAGVVIEEGIRQGRYWGRHSVTGASDSARPDS